MSSNRWLLSCVTLAAAALAPVVTARAQAPVRGQWLVEGQAGGWWHRESRQPGSVYDAGPGGFVGVRLGHAVGEARLDQRLRLVAGTGYGRLGEAYTEVIICPTGEVLRAIHRSELIPLTVGAEYDVVRGRTALAIGIEAGALWTRAPVGSRTGPPPIDADSDARSRDWGSPAAVMLPSVTLRRVWAPTFSGSVSLRALSGQDPLANLLRRPMLALGLAWEP